MRATSANKLRAMSNEVSIEGDAKAVTEKIQIDDSDENSDVDISDNGADIERSESWVQVRESEYKRYATGKESTSSNRPQTRGLFKSQLKDEKIIFRAYEWERFAFLRNLWGIDEKDLVESLSGIHEFEKIKASATLNFEQLDLKRWLRTSLRGHLEAFSSLQRINDSS